MGDTTQYKYRGCWSLEMDAQFLTQKRLAVVDFITVGAILNRQALDGVCDPDALDYAERVQRLEDQIP